MSIRARLLLLYVLVIGLSSIGLLWWATAAIRLRYLESMEESLVDTSVILASLLEKQVAADRIDAATFRDAFTTAYARQFEARIYSVRKTAIDLNVYVTDRRGIVVYDSDGGRAEGQDYSRWNDVLLTLRGQYGARATRVEPDDESTVIIRVAAPIRAEDGAVVGVVSVGKPTTYINQLVATTRQRVVLYGGLVSVGLVAIGWWATMWLTRPLTQLTAHVRALRDGRPSQLPRLTGSEVNALGRALEEMRDALEGRDYVENYVQALTHQIKAPLSAVRGAAELLRESMPAEDRRRFLGNILAETDRIQRIVDRLLQLAAIEKRKGLEDVETLDLREIARSALDELAPAFDARGVQARLDEPPEAKAVRVRGERFLLRQAVLNLLHNAIEFSSAGSTITIGVTAPDERARCEVTDEGPGVPDYALAHVFERFYSLPRPDSGAKSTGLGLSLVREIAHLHDGEARLENLPVRGTRAVLELPVA